MTGPAPSDLVRQMHLLIAEEAYLWDLTEQVTDHYGGGRTVAHGPWRADDCRQILARWFDCGLIDCIAVARATKVRSDEIVHYEYDADWRARATEDGHYLVLAREDAGALLNDPSTWHRDGVGAGVLLCRSDEADGLPFDAWFDKLAGLPDDLIFGQAPPQQTRTNSETILPVRRWMRAMENAAGGPPVRCPVNRDAHLQVETKSETPTSESIDDIFWFAEPGTSLPVGRHRLWCPACGAEQYVVVTPKPG